MSISEYFVSPASGNDTTGDGTIGTPWATVQKALNTITRNATNGDQINVQAGAADVLAGTLSLATYGTPAPAAPLVIRGYTSAANDGGIGVISGAGAYTILNGGTAISWIDMRLTNVGNNLIITTGLNCHLIRCKFDGSTRAGDWVNSIGNGSVIGCYSEGYVTIGGGTACVGNYIKTGRSGINLNGANTWVISNVIRITAASGSTFYGINAAYGQTTIMYNTIDRVAGVGSGILYGAAASRGGGTIVNNIIANFNGASSYGISGAQDGPAVMGYNAFYNCLTNVSLSETALLDLGGNLTLGSDPFTDAANSDYRLVAGTTALEAGWPQAYLNLAVANKIDIGAFQAGAGAAGGGMGGIFGSILK